MKFTDPDIESAHLGTWLPIKSLFDVIAPMAVHYHRRFRRYFIGDSDDLAQSARLALLEWQSTASDKSRIRELAGLSLLHKAMVAEVRQNRRQSTLTGDGKLDSVLDRPQLSAKKIEMLNLFTMNVSKAAKKPYYEMVYLRKVLGWSDAEISRYFQQKKDDRHYWSPEDVAKMVQQGIKRIKRKVSPEVVKDIRLLQFLP